MNRDAILKRLAAIKSEAKAIIDAADKDGAGKLTEDQEKKFDTLMAEREELEANLKRLDQLASMDESTGRKTEPANPAKPEAGRTRIEVRPAIENDPMRGFTSAADFGRAVMEASRGGGVLDKRLQHIQREAGAPLDGEIVAAPSNFHRETGSADGYMVPPSLREEIWKLVFESEGILERVMPEPTQSNSVNLNVDESTPWGATGIQAKWATEGGAMTGSRLASGGRTVQLHKLYAFVGASDELVEDAPLLSRRLTEGASQAIRWKAEEALVNGDGVGKPLGWFKSGALVTVTKETGQAADTVVAGNLGKMYSRLLFAGARDPFWLVNQEVLPQLMGLTVGDRPVWTPPNEGFKAAPGGFLLGRPVVFSEHCEQLGDKGDIHLVAPNGYYATTKAGGVKFDSSIHLYFDYGVQAFRWTFRLGGQPYLSAAVSKSKGSATLSHFVTLEART